MSDGEWVGYDDVETVCAKLQFAQHLGTKPKPEQKVASQTNGTKIYLEEKNPPKKGWIT